MFALWPYLEVKYGYWKQKKRKILFELLWYRRITKIKWRAYEYGSVKKESEKLSSKSIKGRKNKYDMPCIKLTKTHHRE